MSSITVTTMSWEKALEVDLDEYSTEREFYDHIRQAFPPETSLVFSRSTPDIPEWFVRNKSLDSRLWEWVFLPPFHREIWRKYVQDVDTSAMWADARSAFLGEYESQADFAKSVVGRDLQIPKYIKPFINYEEYAKTLFWVDYLWVDGFVYSNFKVPARERRVL